VCIINNIANNCNVGSKMYKKTVKRSVGIACCRYNENNRNMDILLIRKRYTYNFVSFVFGQYNPKDDKRIRCLFNGMTKQEKIEILSLEFKMLWYRIWLEFPEVVYKPIIFGNSIKSINDALNLVITQKNAYITSFKIPMSKIDFYTKKKSKFERCFVIDKGTRLRSLMSKTTNAELPWEIPKGRMQKDEAPIDCAIREFKEETGISMHDYKLLFNISPVVDSYTSMHINYIHKYYIAYADNTVVPDSLFMENEQLMEVDSIKWININDIKYVDFNGKLLKLVERIIKAFKNCYRKTI
jgi:8-oxo-dGTP pyrophosphatase MutT (NUDIX family)